MNTWTTPFERPKELAGRESLTDAEVAEFRKRARRILQDPASAFPVGDGLFQAALINPEHWQNTAGTVENPDESLDRDFDSRTSLVIDPPDGRIPPSLRPESSVPPNSTPDERAYTSPPEQEIFYPSSAALLTECHEWASTEPFRKGFSKYFRVRETW